MAVRWLDEFSQTRAGPQSKGRGQLGVLEGCSGKLPAGGAIELTGKL